MADLRNSGKEEEQPGFGIHETFNHSKSGHYCVEPIENTIGDTLFFLPCLVLYPSLVNLDTLDSNNTLLWS